MYLNHYHLKAKPFGLSPGPHFIWLGKKHEEALAILNYGIVEGLGFLLLTGDVGVGKTALIHRLISNLDSSTIVAHITDPGLGTLDFFRLLAVELDIPYEFNSKAEFLIRLERFLYQSYSDQKKVLLIVDEAQRLSNKLLDQIRVLSNIELSDRKLINIFFVGQPEFKNTLMANCNRAIRQRISINYHIDPLTESETGQYIEHRLKVAGATRKIFKLNAFGEIFRFTKGHPRAINIICDHALVTGYASGFKSIDANVIKECEQELSIRTDFDFSRTNFQAPTDSTRPKATASPPRRTPIGWIAIAIAISILTGAWASYYLLRPASHREMGPIPPEKTADSSKYQAAPVADGPLGVKKTSEKKLDQASSQNEPAIAQAHKGKEPREKAAPMDKMAAAGPKPEVLTDRATPAPDRPPDRHEDDSGVTEPEKAEKVMALAPPPSAAKLGIQPGTDGKKAAVKKQEASAPEKQRTTDDRPPATSAARAVHAPGRPLDKEKTGSGVTGPGNTEKKPAVVAAIPEAKPAVKPETRVKVSHGTGKPETKVLKPRGIKEPNPDTPKRGTKAPPPIRKSGKSTRKAASGNRTPPPKTKQPGKASPVVRPAPPSNANKGARFQSSSGQTGMITATSVKKPDIKNLEHRLRSFLQTYCNTYAAKDMDAFTVFFAANAMENGKPFESLLPKYKRNFKVIETILYRIELRRFSYDDDKEFIKIEGNFFLKWLPPDKNWRENSGKIFMHLKENGASFLVQRLDYHGNGTGKK